MVSPKNQLTHRPSEVKHSKTMNRAITEESEAPMSSAPKPIPFIIFSGNNNNAANGTGSSSQGKSSSNYPSSAKKASSKNMHNSAQKASH